MVIIISLVIEIQNLLVVEVQYGFKSQRKLGKENLPIFKRFYQPAFPLRYRAAVLILKSNYLRNMKSEKALQKLKSSLHVASRNEWQSDYDTPGKISHYYSIVKRELYEGRYPNPLKSFMSSVSRHTFSKLFQLCTGHCVLGKYFRTRGIDGRDHNCKCGQLETVGTSSRSVLCILQSETC